MPLPLIKRKRSYLVKNSRQMKKIALWTVLALCGISAAVLVSRGCRGDMGETPPPLELTDKYKLPFTAGVNINGLEGEWYFPHAMRVLSDESTYVNVKNQGFDHIRIPVDFRTFYQAGAGVLNEELMQKLDSILDLVEKAELYATLDFHGWYELDADVPEQKELFLTLWRLVAERYRDRSGLISFELMNEPGIKTLSAKELNVLQAEAIAVIRETNPTRLIICAVADGNQPWLLQELELPEDDENLAVAVHIYHPGDFTHQGFEWANPPREKGVQVRLTDEMRGELQWNLDETLRFIENSRHPVILNEFGLNLNLADPEDTDWYIRTITSFCRENGIPWTWWGYDNQDMALYTKGKWRSTVLDALFLRG